MKPKECPHNKPKFVTYAGLLCFDCVPAATKKQYPLWEQSYSTSIHRAEQARKNFGYEKEKHEE